jgi:glycosyltransferase involved in cell wall biosynthesis
MRILLTTDYSFPGFGRCSVVNEWARELGERGHQVQLLVGEGDPAMSVGVDHRIFKPGSIVRPGTWEYEERSLFQTQDLAYAHWTGEAIADFAPDLVITADSGDLWAVLVNDPEAPVIATLRTDIEQWRPNERAVMQWLLELSDHALIWNPDNLPTLQVAGLHPDRSSWASSGARVRTPSLHLPGGRPKMVFCGRVDHNKGVDRIVNTLPTILSTAPEASLTIIGDGAQLEAVLQQAADLGVRSSVHSLGWIADANQYLADADLLLLPSAHEGFADVIGQAMLARTACAVNRHSAQPLRNGTLGQPLDPLNDQAMAWEILGFLASSSRPTMVEQAYHVAQAEYSREAALNRIERLAEEVRARPQAAHRRLARRALMSLL